MIEVYAPASIGNFAVGFDSLGAALKPCDGSVFGDVVKISPAAENQFLCTGAYASQLPKAPEQNLSYMCFTYFKRHVAPDLPNAKVELVKNLPVGSGLGSSACSVVATLAALNLFANTQLSQHDLIELMADFEEKVSGGRHYDNIAPCFLGGIQLTGEVFASKALGIPVPKSWHYVVAFPGFSLNTADSRGALPATISLAKSVQFAQRLSAFCTLLHQGKEDSALEIMQDEIAEPHRAKLIAGFSEAKQQLLQLGASTVSISGAGPSLFLVCKSRAIAQKCQQWLSENYINQQGFSHICQLDELGTRQIKDTF